MSPEAVRRYEYHVRGNRLRLIALGSDEAEARNYSWLGFTTREIFDSLTAREKGESLLDVLIRLGYANQDGVRIISEAELFPED